MSDHDVGVPRVDGTVSQASGVGLEAARASDVGSGPDGQRSAPTTAVAPRMRTLRARQSIPSASSTMSGARKPTDAELEAISHRLGPAGVAERREERVKEKEAAVKTVVDEHDTALREKFHLERFVTMITGWNPALAKVDNSPVYLDYKRFQHNIFELAPQQPGNAVAGPSRARGARVPSRQTRRQVHEQIDLFSEPVESTATTQPVPVGKGKGKATVVNVGNDVDLMPPPAIPAGKGKKGRRQTLDPSALVNGDALDDDPVELDSKGKKRGRASLPVPAAKRGPGRPRQSELAAPQETAEESAVEPVKKKRGRPPRASLPVKEDTGTPDVDSATPANAPRSPTPPLVELPSLAHVRFGPPPIRIWPRRTGSRALIYTNPPQKDVPPPKYNGDIAAYLASYIHLDDTGPVSEMKTLEARAEREGFLYNRVNYLQNQGRLSRLLDEDPLAPASVKAVNTPHTVVRQQDHQEALMIHMVQVRNAMLAEAKGKPAVCRKVARMIMAYWDNLHNREEREKAKEEKEMKRRGKELAKGVRKRWALAVKVVRAKIAAEQKAEQDRLGKEHLQSMLQRSTGLLEAQQDFDLDSQAEDRNDSEDGSGQEGEDESRSGKDSMDDGASIGTDEVSAAEDSHIHSSGFEDDDDEDDESDDYATEEAVSREALAALFGGTARVSPSPPATDSGVHEAAEIIQEISEESKGLIDTTTPGPPGLQTLSERTDMATGIISAKDEDMEVDDSDMLAVQPSSSPTPPVRPVVNNHADGHKADYSIDASQDRSAAPAAQPDVVPDRELANGHFLPHKSGNNGDRSLSPSDPAPPPVPVIRSRRARGIAKPLPSPSIADPDVNDREFAAPENEDDVDEEDHAMDVEMEDQEDPQEADSEDEGLLADADIPIEELLKRYGYSGMNGEEGALGQSDEEAADQSISALANGVEMPDQSLTDGAIRHGHSPTLLIDGKRQRKIRQVWTPEDNPPHPAKKPKIEVVKDEQDESVSENETGSDDDSDDEDEEEAQDAEELTAMDGAEEDPNAPKIRPPFLLRGTLRPYQHAGLDWLAGLYANNMNGILADEMGLGKTIQTISLLAHLACDRGVWGQHLIIVPTSVILNWEMEFKKFLPGFKVLTYYGNQKERKEKRVGWLTEHAWQVCITSYQIVLADQHIFRRKSWSYMILDEAHNIKNFRSQRWQTLLGFKAQRRLLLTGTPLQNNLMELWSLLYFLMPHGVAEEATAVVGFANHKDFMEWFSNPMDKAIESGDAMDEDTIATIAKLHTLLRPFILRRLKSEVETQLPGKFEHVVYCKLSKRQRFLYDEFMARASTREALSSGGYLGVMNTLMQLRKVCNHPDLFEVRPVRTSFAMNRSVASDFTPSALLVRQRLLADADRTSAFEIDLFGKEAMSGFAARSISRLDASDQLPHAIPLAKKGSRSAVPKRDVRSVESWLKYRAWMQQEATAQRWISLSNSNRRRCSAKPIYGSTFLDLLTSLPQRLLPLDALRHRRDLQQNSPLPSSSLIMSMADRTSSSRDLVERFAIIPPNAVARDLSGHALPSLDHHPEIKEERFDTLHHAATKLQIAFPDASLLQYDCGKLQKLYEMLRDLKANGHRVLIFTQMTRVLDILEIFLSFNGHRYLRLDGSTKIEDRQVITERFNSDARIFCFIASSRSGGVGINLTGADTVFFYDSDWNPSMDRQCMDRAHRIGQTREVHIYRFVSSHTVEENMLKKANQKRLLDRMVIQDGDFTTEFFGRVDWRNVIDDGQADQQPSLEEKDGIEDVKVEDEPEAEDVTELAPRRGEEREFARMVAEVEDDEDVDAARIALGEGEIDMGDFDAAAGGKSVQAQAGSAKRGHFDSGNAETTPIRRESVSVPPLGDADEEVDYEEDDIGAVDEYMLQWVEEDWAFFTTYKA